MTTFHQKNYPLVRESLDFSIFSTVQIAVETLRRGEMILIVEDEVEDEGDVCIAAEAATPQAINFMATSCRGLICQPITIDIANHLDLPLMVPNGGSPAFTVTVDAVSVGSGTSAFDRARTVRAIANSDTKAEDLRRPGHIFPIIARQGGVLERTGHTEASVDIVRLAGFVPSAVICEVMEDDGYMAGVDSLRRFSCKHNIASITVREMVEFFQCFNNEPALAADVLLNQSKIKSSKDGNNGRH